MSKTITVDVVSESENSVQGHGVHTAYIEMVRALEKFTDLTVFHGNAPREDKIDIVHFHTIGPRVWPKLFKRGARKVMSAHIVPDSFIGSLVLAKYWRFAAVWYMRWFYNRADLLLAVSNEARRDLVTLGVKAPIEVFYNFIDGDNYKTAAISRTDVRQKMNIPDNAFVVIGAGQVQPRKRVDCFFAAAKALPEVHFVWVGGMPFGKIAADSAHMADMMKSAPSNVHFPGIMPLEDMVSYYRAADLFWLPSEQETFGLVVVEAAAAGLPVMVRDIPDYADTFGDDAIKSTDETAVALITKLQSDQTYYQQWQANAAKVAKRFDSRSAAAKLVKLYEQLV